MDYETFSQLIAPQGKGGGSTSTGASGNIYSYQLYSPTTGVTKPDEVPITEQIIVPVQVSRPVLVQPEPTIVVRNPMLQIPDANKLNPVGNGEDEVLWTGLPVPSHWVTYQLGLGGNNEYDHEYDSASLTFPAGRFYVIVSAEGYDPRLFVIDASVPNV